MITYIKHASGKRIAANGLKAENIAAHFHMARSSAQDVLKGMTRKHCKIETMQRMRECMRISYTVTPRGLEYLQGSKSILAAIVGLIAEKAGQEASDISETMLSSGFAKHSRQRVLCDVARAIDKGYVVQSSKLSGAIF